MKFNCLLTAALLVANTFYASAETLEVGSGSPYSEFRPAAVAARPGDTILIHGGSHTADQYVEGLTGEPDRWIYVLEAEGEEAVFDGGSTSWHLVEPAYVYIKEISFRNQTVNGLNVDDGGTFDTPAHDIVFDSCVFSDMQATGNNDLFKMSGVDNFTVKNCMFSNGSDGGSGIDMVGCHYGTFEGNSFEDMGSNSIQAKGGTHDITIRRNRFKNGGERTLNLGGSTGLEFFRPDTAHYEAANLKVYSNVFIGSYAPIAYVGCVNVHVVNNTIYQPEHWVVRILQETVDPERFVECGDNEFRNNIIYLGNSVVTECNIGVNTRPETFTFSNNLWFNSDDQNWNGPDLPVPDGNSIVGSDPDFFRAESEDFQITSISPAVGKGYPSVEPSFDFSGKSYLEPRSIGAFEAISPNAVRQLSGECADQADHPEWIFCDDFEEDRGMVTVGRYFEYDDNSGEFIVVDGVGVNGSKGVQTVFQQGEVGAGGMKLAFGRNPNSYMNKQQIRPDEDFREIYYRMYLKMEEGWQGSPAKLSRATVFVSPDNWAQAMIAHLWSDDAEHLLIDPASCVNEDGNVECQTYNDFDNLDWLGYQSGVTPIFSGDNSGIWFCIEHHVKLNDPGQSNGIQEFWIDGDLEARREGLDFTGTYTEYAINAVFFENYWNDGSVKEQRRYFDNIIISTEPIGCMETGNRHEKRNVIQQNGNIYGLGLEIYYTSSVNKVEIRFLKQIKSPVRIDICNVKGGLVKTIRIGNEETENRRFLYDLSHLACGVYFINACNMNSAVSRMITVIR